MRAKILKQHLITLLRPSNDELPQPLRMLLIGAPGLGKSSVVAQAVNELGFDLIVVHPSVEDPTDPKGMPYVEKRDDGVKAWFVPFAEHELIAKAERPTVVVAEDFGQAANQVQAPYMQMTWGAHSKNSVGTLGLRNVSPHVRWVFTSNRREDRAGVGGILSTIASRALAVVTMTYNEDDHVEWLLRNGFSPELAAFVRWKPDLIADAVPSKDIQKVPDPRSVAALGHLLKMGITDLELLEGAAGLGYAGAFIAFRNVYMQLPRVREDIFPNPNGVKIPSQSDILFALSGAVAYYMDKKTMGAAVQFLARLPSEFAVLTMKDAISRDPSLQRLKAFSDFAMDHKEAFGVGGGEE